MGIYITDADVIAAIGETPLIAVSDDDNDGAPDPAVLAYAIESAEAEVESYLLGFYTFPLTDPTDRLVRLSALDFAVAFLFERHPEYVRNRDSKMGEIRYARAKERMYRIQQARQRLPDESQVAKPKNLGGIITSPDPQFGLGCGNGWPI
jgi:phage gp36-like protein